MKEIVQKALGGLTEIYNYEIDHDIVRIWSKTNAFNITNVLIDNMIKQGFKIQLVTIHEETVELFGGGYTHKPMIVFKAEKPSCPELASLFG